VHRDDPCPVCDGPQVYSDAPRPEYASISGQDQLALLNLNQSGQIRDVQVAGLEAAKELAELRAREAQRDQREAERDRQMAEMADEFGAAAAAGRPRDGEDRTGGHLRAAHRARRVAARDRGMSGGRRRRSATALTAARDHEQMLLQRIQAPQAP
jgi:hypothetical protein